MLPSSYNATIIIHPHTAFYLPLIEYFCIRYPASFGTILDGTNLLLFVAVWLLLGIVQTSNELRVRIFHDNSIITRQKSALTIMLNHL